MRHQSRIFLEVDDERDFAVTITIKCDQCGETKIKFAHQHVGSLLRVLDDANKSLGLTGLTEAIGQADEDTKDELLEKTEREFPKFKERRDAYRRRGMN